MSSPRWETLQPGLRRITHSPGPIFQYYDAVGFEWNTYEVQLPDLPPALEGLRIIHLSDLHCQEHWQTAYDDLLEKLSANEPDLILITGDLTDYIMRPRICLPTARRFLSALRARAGIFGIFGNHDRMLTHAAYNGTPLRLLDGEKIIIKARGESIELIAMPGPERLDCPEDFYKTMPHKTAGIPQIVLSHYPDHFRRMKKLNPDLFLSGHTHGGQMCLPGGIQLLRHDSLPLHLLKGVHRLGKTWFFVSRGLGFSTLNFRVFCPAEIIEIRLSRNIEL